MELFSVGSLQKKIWALVLTNLSFLSLLKALTCERGHSLANVLWFISLSSSFKALRTVAWFHCSAGKSSNFEQLLKQKAKSRQKHHLHRCILFVCKSYRPLSNKHNPGVYCLASPSRHFSPLSLSHQAQLPEDGQFNMQLLILLWLMCAQPFLLGPDGEQRNCIKWAPGMAE